MTLTAKDGSDVRLALLPFVSKRGIVRAEQLMSGEAFEHAQRYGERLRLLLETMCASFHADTVNVIVAHAFVLGAAAGGGERAAHLVEEYAVTAQSFPGTIGYGALGHLHRPQRIAAAAPLHYCGSPLQLDFGEGEEPKQVNVVTMAPGVPADVRPVRLRAGRSLRTLRGTVEQLEAVIVEDDPWLRVVVDGPSRAGLAHDVREILGERVVDVRINAPATTTRTVAAESAPRSPQALFDAYLERQSIDDQRVRLLFHELLDADHEANAR
jgi:exonuclease SbcD